MAKTLVVVGAGPGVGRAVAERFGREGYRVALIARNSEKLAKIVGDLDAQGIEAAAFPADVRDRAGLAVALNKVIDSFGAIDVLEYSPTGTSDNLRSPRNMTEDNEQYHLDICVLGAITAVNTVLPAMQGREGAAILFTTAASAQYPVPFTASFGVAAGASLNYARVLHQELAPEGIHVGILSIAGLVVAPGQEQGRSAKGLSLMTAEQVAERLWTMARERGQVESIIGDTEVLRHYSAAH
ncbi:MAG: hypothetical protein VR73_10515 [Gammaproteobacteria bacterium BRH_c0]|nr:MAG: hypothetical protein VR73_10515 [Gammaproteobacteria bacterium BRH_c0]